VDAFKSMLPSIEQVHDPVERSAIAHEMADYLKIDREVISKSMRRASGPEQSTRQEIASAIPPNEKLLVACLLASTEARSAIKHYLAGSNMLPILELRSIFETLLALDSEGIAFSLEALASRLEPRLQRILTDLSFSDISMDESRAEEQALHSLRALEIKSVNAECEALRRRIRESELSGNFGEMMRLTAELDRIRRASSGP
jgi:DNA primase